MRTACTVLFILSIAATLLAMTLSAFDYHLLGVPGLNFFIGLFGIMLAVTALCMRCEFAEPVARVPYAVSKERQDRLNRSYNRAYRGAK